MVSRRVMTIISKARARYKYHRKLRKLGIEYDTTINTIYVPYGTTHEELAEPILILMRVYGYSVTSKIV
jgi:hypothetical protein